ncbi:MAG: acetyl-CoA C-acetyltransferase [Tissierellia bacterium]|nr:acetyl-CoA C-acetyltransferase [Tissierellia bacterium]
MSKVFITSAKRTPIGNFSGTLKGMSPGELGAIVVKNILEESKLDGAKLDEVVMGNVLSAGQGQNVARQVSLKGGVPSDVPAYGINMVCGSGMKAVMNAFTSVKAGLSNLVIAGGAESMSQAPYLVSGNNRNGVKMGNQVMVDHMIKDGLWDVYNDYHMGITAENIAEKHGLTREEQDAFAAGSQQRAVKAVEEGLFDDEIVPVVLKSRKGEVVFDKDEYPKAGTTEETLGKLRPAFKKDGTVTAGNASGLNDSASACLVASEEAVKENGLTPLVEVVSVGQGGVDPSVMGLGPVPAIRNALKAANLELKDIDVLELNEAFAAQSLGVVTELAEEHGVSKEEILSKTNLNGGAIAIGHPIGASGNRIIVTLIHLMKKHGYKYGLASLCIGGGMGTAVILRNTDVE